jgi:hypothetical protein
VLEEADVSISMIGCVEDDVFSRNGSGGVGAGKNISMFINEPRSEGLSTATATPPPITSRTIIIRIIKNQDIPLFFTDAVLNSDAATTGREAGACEACVAAPIGVITTGTAPGGGMMVRGCMGTDAGGGGGGGGVVTPSIAIIASLTSAAVHPPAESACIIASFERPFAR